MYNGQKSDDFDDIALAIDICHDATQAMKEVNGVFEAASSWLEEERGCWAVGHIFTRSVDVRNGLKLYDYHAKTQERREAMLPEP